MYTQNMFDIKAEIQASLLGPIQKHRFKVLHWPQLSLIKKCMMKMHS